MQCEICHRAIGSNRELRNHLKYDHGMTPQIYYEKYPDATKLCSTCKKELPITNFFSDKSNNFGFRTQCVNCMHTEGRKRECPICHRLFQWSAVITHLKDVHNIPPIDGFEKYLREKYCPKCDEVKPLEEFYRLNDDNLVYFSWCKRCNYDRNIERLLRDKEFTLPKILLVRLAFGDRCFICGMSHNESMERLGEPLHLDHLIPHVKDGVLSMENVTLLCKTCNLKKGNKSLEEFLRHSYTDETKIREKLEHLREIVAWANVELERLALYHLHYQGHLSRSEQKMNSP